MPPKNLARGFAAPSAAARKQILFNETPTIIIQGLAGALMPASDALTRPLAGPVSCGTRPVVIGRHLTRHPCPRLAQQRWMECHGISLSCVSFCAASHTNALLPWDLASVSRMNSSAESSHQTISGLVRLPKTAPREIKLTHTLPTAAGGCFEKPRRDLVVWRTPA